MSAERAKLRLQLVVAMDRTNLRGGRQTYYTGSGSIRFDPPITVVANEMIVYELEYGFDGLTKHWAAALIKEPQS